MCMGRNVVNPLASSILPADDHGDLLRVGMEEAGDPLVDRLAEREKLVHRGAVPRLEDEEEMLGLRLLPPQGLRIETAKGGQGSSR